MKIRIDGDCGPRGTSPGWNHNTGRVLSRHLSKARATPYTVTVTLTREDWENFAAFRDAWNAYRVRRGLPRLTTDQTISKALEGAAAWLAGKDPQ